LDPTLLEHLLVRLRAELGLLVGGDQDQLRAARVGRRRAGHHREEAHRERDPTHPVPVAGGPVGGNSLLSIDLARVLGAAPRVTFLASPRSGRTACEASVGLLTSFSLSVRAGQHFPPTPKERACVTGTCWSLH